MSDPWVGPAEDPDVPVRPPRGRRDLVVGGAALGLGLAALAVAGARGVGWYAVLPLSPEIRDRLAASSHWHVAGLDINRAPIRVTAAVAVCVGLLLWAAWYALRRPRTRLSYLAAALPLIPLSAVVGSYADQLPSQPAVLRAYDVHTGELRWVREVPLAFGSILATPGRVHVTGSEDCYDAATVTLAPDADGREVWRKSFPDKGCGLQASAVGDRLAYVDFEEGQELLVDARSGADRGSRPIAHDGNASDGETDAILEVTAPPSQGVHSVRLLVTDTRTGRGLWHRDIKINGGYSAEVHDGVVLAKEQDRKAPPRLVAYDARSGRELWRLETRPHLRDVVDGRVYLETINTTSGRPRVELRVVALRTGRALWQRPSHGTLASVGEVIVESDLNPLDEPRPLGIVVSDPATGKTRWSTVLPVSWEGVELGAGEGLVFVLVPGRLPARSR